MDQEVQGPVVSVTVKDLDDLNLAIFQQREKIEQMEAAVKEENKLLQRMEAKLVAYLKELGRDKYQSPYGTVSITERYTYKLPASDEDRAKFFEYLKGLGVFDRLITVNHQTLNSFAKEQQKIAEEEGRGFDFSIPGIGAPSLYETLNIRKSKG
jgi:hypothetical protein